MAKIKLTFEVDKDMIDALQVVDTEYKIELDRLVDKLVETQYKKKVDSKVRDFLLKQKELSK